MSDDITHFALEDDASPIDRATLRFWKTWLIWLRPILFASVLMMIVSAAVGTTIAKSGGIDNGFVGVWSPANYAAVTVAPGETEGPDIVLLGSAAWTRGILAQFVSVLAATAVALLVIRRTARPIAVGVISGFIVVIVHLTLSQQWSLQPVADAPTTYQVAAVVALWLQPVVLAATGSIVEARRGAITRGRRP